MRHKKKNKHLGRTSSHRSAMLSNMASSLIMHKRIFTTVPKAKALRRYVEPIITVSKEDTTSSRRKVFSKLQNKYAVTELFQIVSQKVGDRPGGYTRIIKTGNRLGDNASMCFIELVDFNENMLSDSTTTKRTRTRRSRRKRGGDGSSAAVTAADKTEVNVKSEERQNTKTKEAADKVEETTETKDSISKAKVDSIETKDGDSKVKTEESKKNEAAKTNEEADTKIEVTVEKDDVEKKKVETESRSEEKVEEEKVDDDQKEISTDEKS